MKAYRSQEGAVSLSKYDGSLRDEKEQKEEIDQHGYGQRTSLMNRLSPNALHLFSKNLVNLLGVLLCYFITNKCSLYVEALRMMS